MTGGGSFLPPASGPSLEGRQTSGLLQMGGWAMLLNLQVFRRQPGAWPREVRGLSQQGLRLRTRLLTRQVWLGPETASLMSFQVVLTLLLVNSTGL